METLDDPLLREIMTRFKENSKSVTKDLLSGIGMFGFAARLILYLALLVATQVFVFVWIGYYQLGQLYGQVAIGFYIFAAGYLVAFFVLFRRKHLTLKKKYASLFELFDKLGAK